MKKAVIFDIDNTLLYHTNRNPFNWSDLSGDTLIPEMNDILEWIWDSVESPDVIIVTGRPEHCRAQTEQWLKANNVYYDELYMKDGDPKGKAVSSKLKTLLKLKEEYDSIIAFEDDNKCAQMYIDNGIFTLMPLNYKIDHKKLKQQEIIFP